MCNFDRNVWLFPSFLKYMFCNFYVEIQACLFLFFIIKLSEFLFNVFILRNTIESRMHSSNKHTVLFLDVLTSETKRRWFHLDVQTNFLTTVLLVPSVPAWWLRSIVTTRLIPSFLKIMPRKSLSMLHQLFHLNKNFRYFKNKVKLSIDFNLYFSQKNQV